MEQILTNSLIYRSWDRLCSYFAASNTYKVLLILLNWCKNSATNRFILRFLARNSSLKYSLTYRIFSKVFSLFDRLWDRIYKFAISCGKSSSVISFIRDSFCQDNSFTAYGLIVLFFSVGFSLTSLFVGTFDILKAAIAGMGFLAALLLFIGNTRWIACLKGSIFWRFVLYIFD